MGTLLGTQLINYLSILVFWLLALQPLLSSLQAF
jgi:hypothetical protein